MNEMSQKRKERLMASANLREVKFPDSCLNCVHSDESGEFCYKLTTSIEPFMVCDFHDLISDIL